MRKRGILKKSIISLFLAGALLLGGCAQGKTEGNEKTGTKWGFKAGEHAAQEEVDFSFLADEEGTWKDNSLDDWQGVFNKPLNIKEVEGENEYGNGSLGKFGMTDVSENGAFYLQSPSVDSRLREIIIDGISNEGETFSYQIEDRELTIGSISGEKGYVAAKSGEDGFLLYGLDERFQKIWERKVNVSLEVSYPAPFISSLRGDDDGNVHVLIPKENWVSWYVIFSPDGEPIFKQVIKNFNGFCTFGNGRVGLRKHVVQQAAIDYYFYEADLETGELREIALFDWRKIKTNKERLVKGVTLINENEIVWLGVEGIYHYDMGKDEETLVYKWANHGIRLNSSSGIFAMRDGNVGVLYMDIEGINYLLLKPTEEKQEIQALTIAVSPQNKSMFEGAVAYFSKRHPEYAILLKDDYDKMSLLTQLGAGDGPIIIDTALTGFEDLGNLWQPLDGFLEKSGVMEELIPEVLEFGKIGDRTYGIVTNFYVQTMVLKKNAMPNLNLEDWNYDAFLDFVDGYGAGKVFSYSYVGGTPNYQKMFLELLNNGLYDNYYVDMDEEKLRFGTEEFQRVLRLSQKAKEGEGATETAVELKEGKVACEIVDLYYVSMVDRLRGMLMDGEASLIGRPTKDGAKHFLVGGNPIVIRSTCSEEEKKVAYTFLRDMLSKEVLQTTPASSDGSFFKFGLVVRRDVLEHNLAELADNKAISSIQGQYGKVSDDEYAELQKQAYKDQREEIKKVQDFLWELLRNAKVQKKFPPALQQVFDEELTEYRKGVIDGEMAADHLENRFRLFLEETK